MTEGTSLETHINEFNKVIMDLKNIDVKVDDESQFIIALCFLPSSYEQFITTLFYGKDTIPMDNVEAPLHSKELGNKMSREEGED